MQSWAQARLGGSNRWRKIFAWQWCRSCSNLCCEGHLPRGYGCPFVTSHTDWMRWVVVFQCSRQAYLLYDNWTYMFGIGSSLSANQALACSQGMTKVPRGGRSDSRAGVI